MSLKRGEKRSSFTRPDFGWLCEKKGGGEGGGLELGTHVKAADLPSLPSHTHL